MQTETREERLSERKSSSSKWEKRNGFPNVSQLYSKGFSHEEVWFLSLEDGLVFGTINAKTVFSSGYPISK